MPFIPPPCDVSHGPSPVSSRAAALPSAGSPTASCVHACARACLPAHGVLPYVPHRARNLWSQQPTTSIRPEPCRFLCTHELSRSRLPPPHESCTATCGATGGARQVRPPRTYAGCNVVNSNSSSNINRMLLQQQNAAAAAHDKPWTPRGQPRVGPPRQLTWWRRCRFCRPPRALGECRECSGRGPTASDTCEATAVADDAGGVAQPTAPQPRRDPPVAEQAPSPALLPDSGTGQTRRRRSSALHRQAGPKTSPTNLRSVGWYLPQAPRVRRRLYGPHGARPLGPSGHRQRCGVRRQAAAGGDRRRRLYGCGSGRRAPGLAGPHEGQRGG